MDCCHPRRVIARCLLDVLATMVMLCVFVLVVVAYILRGHGGRLAASQVAQGALGTTGAGDSESSSKP